MAVLDAGGQYVDLVRKAVQRLGFPADVLPLNTDIGKIQEAYSAIIISGSPASSHEGGAPQPDPNIWTSDLPVLGICYGMQAMVVANGGQVAKNAIREDGRVTTHVDTTHPLFRGTKAEFTGLFTHGDFVQSLPDGYNMIGSHKMPDGATAYSAIANGSKLGVQFHPEVFDDTPEGYQVFKNFLEDVAGLKPDPTFQHSQIKQRIEQKVQAITEQVGDSHVIAFVSGGVDSSVAATLAARVIPKERLHAFYIDSGFMRDEDDEVVDTLRAVGLSVEKIDAVSDFENGEVNIDGKKYGPLSSVTDPEEKRKIIGKVFIDIQNAQIAKLNLDNAYLLQGTNAADRIESGHSIGDSHTMTIKTHHNQVKEVQDLKAQGLLVEPLDDLFKDEIRELGKELGLPEELVQRQPFPGPGLAIRMIATDQSDVMHEPHEDQVKIQEFLDTQTKTNLTAHLLPIRSVGVGGDERSHLSVVALQDPSLDRAVLASLGSELPAHFRLSVNRVIYALGPNPLDDCSITKTLLTRETSNQLREADAIVFHEMREAGLMRKIIQFPVVLLPLSFGESGGRSIVLRPVITSTFMTVQAMLPGRDLPEEFFKTITERILSKVPHINQVFLDITNKPPATTEWE